MNPEYFDLAYRYLVEHQGKGGNEYLKFPIVLESEIEMNYQRHHYNLLFNGELNEGIVEYNIDLHGPKEVAHNSICKGVMIAINYISALSLGSIMMDAMLIGTKAMFKLKKDGMTEIYKYPLKTLFNGGLFFGDPILMSGLQMFYTSIYYREKPEMIPEPKNYWNRIVIEMYGCAAILK